MKDVAILQDRARELARPLPRQRDVRPRAVLRFRRGEERFAVEVGAVQQVVALDGAASLPDAAWPLVAVAPLRDQIVPVYELVAPARRPAVRMRLAWGVAVTAVDRTVLLAADEVVDVAEVDGLGRSTATGTEADPVAHSGGPTRDGHVVVDLQAVASAVVPDRPPPAPSGDLPPTAAARSVHP